MPTLRSSESSESDNGIGSDNSQPGDSSSDPLKFALMKRSRLMGTRGLEASTIGFFLVGCVLFGFFVGQWLDRRLGTNYWMPVLLLVSIVAGFREMFRTIAGLSNQPPMPRQERAQSTLKTGKSARSAEAQSGPAEQSTLSEEKSRARIFAVPPPPTASFDRAAVRQPEPKAEAVEDDPEALIRKLLAEAESDEDGKADKPV